MGRTVTVELKADVAAFLGPVLEADKATGKLDKSVEALDHDINKLPADALKAGAGLGLLGESAQKTSEEVDGLGKKTEQFSTKARPAYEDAGKLDKRIQELRTSVKALADEFDRTGSKDTLKKFRSDSSELAGLTKMRKEFGGLADDAKKVLSPLEQLAADAAKFSSEAEKAGMSLGSLFSGGLTSPAGLTALAALAPLLLGAAGGLTALAAAGAVAGAGVGGAVMGNPTVFQQEWSSAIGAIKTDWVNASQPFVGPTMDAIRTIGPLVASWHIDTMFAKAAGYVGPLVHGVEGFVTGIEHGVDDLVGKAGPVVAVFAADLPKIGDAIGQAFSMIADNAAGGAEALHAIDNAIADFIAGAGGAIAGAEAIASAITTASNATKNWLDSVPGWVSVAILPFGAFKAAMDAVTPDTLKAAEGGQVLSHALTGVALTGAIAADQAKADATQYAALATQIGATTVTVDTLAAKMVDKLFNGMMSLDQATLHWHESLTKIATSIAKGGDAIDENTAKGQKNVAAILGAVQANMQLYQAQMSAGMKAEDAAALYDTNTAALERQLHTAGLTSAQIDGLIGKYRGIPTRVDTAIAIEGLTNAINDLDDLLRRLNHIPSRKDVTIYTHTGTVGGKEGPAFYAQGGIRHAAEGLIVPPRNPGTVLFGEPQTGGEAFIPLRGISQHAAMGLAQTVGNAYGFQVSRQSSGGWSGSGAVRHEFVVTGDVGSLERVAADAFMGLVRTGKVQIRSSQILPN